MSDEINQWAGLTEYRVGDGEVISTNAYHVTGGAYTRITLSEDDREVFDTVDAVPEEYDLVGVAENHPHAAADPVPEIDLRVFAVFAPFHGHEWGVVELDRTEAADG